METLAAAIESSNDTQLKEEFQDLKSKIKLKKGNLREFATKPIQLKTTNNVKKITNETNKNSQTRGETNRTINTKPYIPNNRFERNDVINNPNSPNKIKTIQKTNSSSSRSNANAKYERNDEIKQKLIKNEKKNDLDDLLNKL